jgi:heme exporter protein A
MATLTLAHIAVRLSGRWVLSGINAAVQAGQAVLLTGSNGAGKTTLLRVIATALRPHHGTLTLFGQAGLHASRTQRPHLTLMTHQHYFYEALTARQNLALVAKVSGRTLCASACDALLASVGLERHADRSVQTYSAGMKRRLALGRTEFLAPKLVLLDEPFGQLDPEGVALMTAAIARMRARNTTLVMATHDIERSRPLCDVHWHLTGGRGGLAVSNIERHHA